MRRGHGGSDGTDPNSGMGQSKKPQDEPWARLNRPKTYARPNTSNTNPGAYRADPRPGSDRTDPRPTLGQTEQTPGQTWTRLSRLWLPLQFTVDCFGCFLTKKSSNPRTTEYPVIKIQCMYNSLSLCL